MNKKRIRRYKTTRPTTAKEQLAELTNAMRTSFRNPPHMGNVAFYLKAAEHINDTLSVYGIDIEGLSNFTRRDPDRCRCWTDRTLRNLATAYVFTEEDARSRLEIVRELEKSLIILSIEYGMNFRRTDSTEFITEIIER